jgi:hypothetical protein
MAFVPWTGSPNIPKFPYVADASVSFTKGFLAYRDTSTGEIKEMTTTTGDVTTIEGIVAETVTTAASNPEIDLTPVTDGMLVIADCTNNTAANQLNKAHLLTDGGTVNNTSTHSSDVNAVFVALRQVGVAADKKLLGRIVVKLGQAAA